MAELLQGRRIVVTGAASGIGDAAAKTLAAAGASLVLWDVDEDAVVALAETLATNQQHCSGLRVDVRSDTAVAEATRRSAELMGGLDGAFNNAGVGAPTLPLDALEEADFDHIISVNLKGVWLCMKYQIRHMRDHGGGSIVNNSSVSGLVALGGQAAYTASKHGVVGLSKAAAVEGAPAAIRVNAVCPGAVRTPLLHHLEEAGITEAMLAEMSPQARVAEPAEVADAVLWLLSNQSSFVTGAAVPVDGGWSAR